MLVDWGGERSCCDAAVYARCESNLYWKRRLLVRYETGIRVQAKKETACPSTLLLHVMVSFYILNACFAVKSVHARVCLFVPLCLVLSLLLSRFPNLAIALDSHHSISCREPLVSCYCSKDACINPTRCARWHNATSRA